MLGALTINLWTYIFEFLDQKDCFGVEIVCKRFSQILRENDRFWARECLNKYFSFDLELYSEIYQSEDYKANLKNKISCAAGRQWRNVLREGVELEKHFFSVINQISMKEETEDFMRDFIQTLREPNLPVASLKRETFAKNTQTAFQNKLSEVLYEDCIFSPKKLNFVQNSKAIIDKLEFREKCLLKEIGNEDKNRFMKARWYMAQMNPKLLEEAISEEKQKIDMVLDSYNQNNSQSQDVSTEDSFLVNSNHSYLLNMYDCLSNALIHFCHLVSEYLSCLDNYYDLLAEYNVRWRLYVCSMLEIEKTFSTFTELLNKAYGAVFEGYPGFPKFSIWRLMTKIWINEVYGNQKLKQSLNAAFQQILINHRDKNVKKMICNDQILEFSDIHDPTIPKCLYINFQTLKSQESNFSTSERHVYFEDNCQAEKELLSEYMQSILDLSLNEVSVHFFDCTELPVSCFYEELEDLFLSSTQAYYQCHQPLFNKCPEYFCAFVKSDCSVLAETFIERTKQKFVALQVNHGLQFLRNLIKDQVESFNLLDLVQLQTSTLISEESDLEMFINENVKEVLEEVKEKVFYEPLKNNCDFFHKIKVDTQKRHKTLKVDFAYLMKTVNNLNEMTENDKYIKYTNSEKNIPFELGDTDMLFYNLERDMSIALLEKLHEEYLLMSKDENEGEMKSETNTNTNMMLPEVGEFDFLEDVDLMNLDNLQLRRTLY